VPLYDSATPDQAQAKNSLSTTPTAVTDPTPVNEFSDQNLLAATSAPPQTSEVRQSWTASGSVISVDDFGFELAEDVSGETIYVELGPTTYWQAQGVSLVVGESVTVIGFAQDGLYHAAVVSTLNGGQISVRDTASGQPLWSGGASGGQSSGTQIPESQVAVDEWITVEGVVSAVAQNSLTVETADAGTLTLQLGRPGFATEQAVNFVIGDQVRVIGYDNMGQFRAGEIDNLTQGGRLMLLDPNGRPLWAGPGSTGGQSGQGSQGQRGQQGGQGSQGGQGQGGQGRGYRGGRTS